MTLPLQVIVPLFLLSAGAGVFAADRNHRGLLKVMKPVTTALLFVVVGWPESRFAWLITVGIAFSLGGDVALLSPAKNAFLVGLGLFLIAHLAYIVAFVGAATGGGADSTGFGSLPVLSAAAVMAIVTALLLRKLWPGAVGMRGPVAGYAVVLAAMVVSAVAAVQDWPSVRGTAAAPAAAIGAALFYVSDASLALEKFHRRFKHAPLLTLGVYWLGQLGIALAARAMSHS